MDKGKLKILLEVPLFKKLGFLTAVVLAPTYAYGDEEIMACLKNHDLCTQTCLEETSRTVKATCIAKCAGVEARCVGELGLKESQPFIRKKAEELERFLHEFFDDVLPLPDEKPPAPQPETRTET